MSGSQKPLEPVAPDGMELLFFYRCPHCLRHVPLVNPVEPRNVRCDGCGKQFPIIPVDEHGLHYVRIMLANGKAYLSTDPYIIMFPALFISLLEISFNLFGNGLRDAFNPSLRGVE